MIDNVGWIHQCRTERGVWYAGTGCMENKPYQLRYLPIFEQDLINTANYITNVLKNEDEALRLIVIWRSRWWKERSLSVTAHRRHWIRRLLLLFYFGIPVSRPLLIVLPIVMVMHFVSVCCDHDLMFLDLDEVNFIFDVSCKQNLYIIDRETADPVLGMGIGANRQYSCYQFIIFIFKWCII